MQCPYFNKGCGGCTGLDQSYESTLQKKEEAMHRLFPDALPILPAEKPLHYRNKSLRTFAGGKGKLVSGIYRSGTHQVAIVISSMVDCRIEERDRKTMTAIPRTPTRSQESCLYLRDRVF